MSTTEIAVREQAPSALVTREYLNEKAQLVRSLYAPDASDAEFEHFIEVCATRGLNPLNKQIYCISRFDKREGRKVATIQTGIDGFRLIAQRSGEYRGQVGPEWCGPDGQWVSVWLASERPAAARVGVLRAGFDAPVYGVATLDAYEDSQSPFWKGAKASNQLAKCAEALALRKAFPEELSGLYTSDEMGQADRAVDTPAAAAGRKPSRQEVIQTRQQEAEQRAGALGVTDFAEFFKDLGVTHPDQLYADAKWDKVASALKEREEVRGKIDEALTPDEVTHPEEGDGGQESMDVGPEPRQEDVA